MIKYYSQFLKKLKVFNFYLIEFYQNYFIKPKIYLLNYIIKNFNKKLVIFIIYNNTIIL